MMWNGTILDNRTRLLFFMTPYTAAHKHTNTKKPKWIYNQCNTLESTADSTTCVNAMDRHMQHAVFHTFAFLAFSCLAFSTLAFWCRIFMSRNFMSRIFSVPNRFLGPIRLHSPNGISVGLSRFGCDQLYTDSHKPHRHAYQYSAPLPVTEYKSKWWTINS